MGHDTKSILKTLNFFYSNLARTLLAKLPKVPNWCTIKFVSDYYKKLWLPENLTLDWTTEGYLFKLLKNVEVTKAAGIDQISGKFLKDGARILVKPISELCNLSMILGSFPDACKIVKVKKPLFKKGSKTDPSNYGLISLLLLLSNIFERFALDQTKEFWSLSKIYMTINPALGKTTQQIHLSFLNDKILKGFDDDAVVWSWLTSKYD